MPAGEQTHEWISFTSEENKRTWWFDVTFLVSGWTCIWGRGCPGVLTEAAEHLGQGCCSFGAHYSTEADRDRVEAVTARLKPEEWQYHRVADHRGGPTKRTGREEWATRVADAACIYLNRPDFVGGAGCALHLAARARGERPLDWKPDVCWQLPLRLLEEEDDQGHVTVTVREWRREDWGAGGTDFGWWCTESPEAFNGVEPVYRALRDELCALVGPTVYGWLDHYLSGRTTEQLVAHPSLRRS